MFENQLFKNMIEKISNKLTGERKKLFDSGTKTVKEKYSSGKKFLSSLTYKGFGEGGPLFTTGKLGWAVSLGATAYGSQDEIMSIYSSAIDEKKDLFSIDNAFNAGEILGELFLFKQLGLIRGVVYEFLLKKVYDKLGGEKKSDLEEKSDGEEQ